MSRTMAVHVRYKSSYIALPYSAKQQCEMTNGFAYFREPTPLRQIFRYGTDRWNYVFSLRRFLDRFAL